jgi:hypothetical protein
MVLTLQLRGFLQFWVAVTQVVEQATVRQVVQAVVAVTAVLVVPVLAVKAMRAARVAQQVHFTVVAGAAAQVRSVLQEQPTAAQVALVSLVRLAEPLPTMVGAEAGRLLLAARAAQAV